MRILQASDLHMDAAYGRLDKTSEEQESWADEQRDVFSRLIDLAVKLQPEALVIPGDLLIASQVYASTLAFMGKEFARLGKLPVLVVPGNQDPFAFYQERVRWPGNVHIFGPEWTGVDVGSGVVWGYGHDRREEERHLIPLLPAFNTKRVNVVAFHGSDEERRQRYTLFAPFTASELRKTGLDYAALGHYHQAALVEDEQGPLGAYAGGLRGWVRPEGGRYALLVEVGKGTHDLVYYFAAPEGFQLVEGVPVLAPDAAPRPTDRRRRWRDRKSRENRLADPVKTRDR